MKKERIFYRTAFELDRLDHTDEEGILREVTTQVQEKARNSDLFEIRRVDIRDREAIVFVEGTQAEGVLAARGLRKETAPPKGFEKVEEEEVFGLR